MNKTTKALIELQRILEEADAKDPKLLNSFLDLINALPAHVRDRNADFHIKQIRAAIERRLEPISS